MSLVHKKKSLVFAETKKTPYKLKIQEIINKYKNKNNITERSTSQIKPKLVQKLSLTQAKNLQDLHIKTVRSRRSSLNTLIKDFDRNCIENVEQRFQTIDEVKMELFRSGVYYRSFERSSGAGVKKLDTQALKQYKDWNPLEVKNQKKVNKFKRAHSHYQKPVHSLPTNSKLFSQTQRGFSTINI